jgi:hypothetical protein
MPESVAITATGRKCALTMTDDTHSNSGNGSLNLDILEPSLNIAYLPQPIPATRDSEILDLLSRVIAEKRVARFRASIKEGHANVLGAFSERLVSMAVRKKDFDVLSQGLVALLLAWRETDSRELFPVMSLYCDATLLLGLKSASLVDSARQILGDVLVEPIVAFLARSEANRSLQAMGYTRASDNDGFRYVRNW